MTKSPKDIDHLSQSSLGVYMRCPRHEKEAKQ